MMQRADFNVGLSRRWKPAVFLSIIGFALAWGAREPFDLRSASAAELEPAPAPPDNPLKGFMPYAGAHPAFPHSLEWTYLHLREVWETFIDGLAVVTERVSHSVTECLSSDISHGMRLWICSL